MRPNIGLKNIWSDRSTRLNLLIICSLYFLAFGADFLCSWSPIEAGNQRISYSPPISIKFSFEHGLYFHPYIIQVNEANFQRNFEPQTNEFCSVDFLARGDEYKLFGLSLNRHLIGSNNCPESFHLMGTDRLGRDYFARLLHGLRPSLFTGLLGIIISFPLGVIYGGIAGYKSASIGEIMMRGVEVILSLPKLYLLVILAAILPASLSNLQRLALITIILAFLEWAGLARIIRGQVLSITKREFVQAAVLNGASDFKIIIREIIPQLSSYLIIAITLSFPAYVLGETTLSFLGLGVNQPDPSLGNLLSEGRELSNLFLRPWIAIGPTLVIILLTWCFNSLGDHLRDIFDPKSE